MVSPLSWFASLFEAHKSQSGPSFQFRDLQKNAATIAAQSKRC
jgi:hypothetical protein